jgi:hypothetical protein
MESFGTEINGHLMNHSIDDHSKSILKQPSITRGMHKSEDENAKSLSKINVFDHNNPYVTHWWADYSKEATASSTFLIADRAQVVVLEIYAAPTTIVAHQDEQYITANCIARPINSQ